MEEPAPLDGRHARRERSRQAVVEAVFALVQAGKVPPTVEQVAEEAGVSVSSIFRNFDGLADLQRQAFDLFQQRYAHLMNPGELGADGTFERTSHLVRTRIKLYTVAGPLMQIARQRALDYAPMADRVAQHRTRLAEQVQHCFAAESSQLTPADAANLLALIDATISPEAFEVMSASHGRTSRQISRTWVTAIQVLMTGWNIDITKERTT